MTGRFTSDFRNFFLRGLAAVLPTLLSLMLIIYVLNFVQKYIGHHINTGALWLIERAWRLGIRPETDAARAQLDRTLASMRDFWATYLWWIGFLMAIVAIYFFGRFLRSVVGRWLWRGVDGTLSRLPLVRQVYPAVKQLTDFLLSAGHRVQFRGVVAVEYPRKGIWSLGLVTGPSLKTLKNSLSENLVTVFIPSSPAPFTGYTITVHKDEIIPLSMSIDEALQFTVTGGVVRPSREKLSPDETPEIDGWTLEGPDAKEEIPA